MNNNGNPKAAELQELIELLGGYAGNTRMVERHVNHQYTQEGRWLFQDSLADLDQQLLHAWLSGRIAGAIESLLVTLRLRLADALGEAPSADQERTPVQPNEPLPPAAFRTTQFRVPQHLYDLGDPRKAVSRAQAVEDEDILVVDDDPTNPFS